MVSRRVVIHSIARVWRTYLVVCGFMTVIGLTLMVFHVVLALDSLLAHFYSFALKLWGAIASMRLLGLLFRSHKSRLGWFCGNPQRGRYCESRKPHDINLYYCP